MKHLLLALAFAGGMLALGSSEASAWACRAESSWGTWGSGRGVTLRAARTRALRDCGRRSPRGLVCYVTDCRR